MKNNLKDFINSAKTVTNTIAENGKSFFDKTIKDVKENLKTPEERLEKIEKIIKSNDISNEEKVNRLKDLFGMTAENSTVNLLEVEYIAKNISDALKNDSLKSGLMELFQSKSDKVGFLKKLIEFNKLAAEIKEKKSDLESKLKDEFNC